MKNGEEVARLFLTGVSFSPREGENPVGALQRFLKEENGGKVLPWVEDCAHVTYQALPLSVVQPKALTHYQQADPRPLLTPAVTVPPVAGVLVVHRGNLRLVDGYHRLKYLLAQGERTAPYLILSRLPWEDELLLSPRLYQGEG